MEEENDNLHIVVFPWLAFGHMLPFLELSKSLAKRGHRISFISTPRNIERLPKPPSHLSHLIHFHSLPLPPVAGLPPSAESTTDIPHDEIPLLKLAFDGLLLPFSEFLTNTESRGPKPDAIIHDFAHHWIPKIAAEIHVPSVLFYTIPAAAISFFGPTSEIQSRKTFEDFTVSPPWVPFESKVAYRVYEARKLFENAKHHEDAGASEGVRVVSTVQGCDFIVLRGCLELEGEWLNLLREIIDKPIIPLGLLPPAASEFGGSENESDGEVEISKWLDKQRIKSVVYIAFGTEVAVSTELVHEVAYGLEVAKVAFIWVLRNSNNLDDLLPKGFEDRTKGYGIVVINWAPQLKILAHEAVGGFMTHCGWSSIIEGLQFGHPLVLFPIFGDQGLSARMMEEKGFGIEVERNEDDGYFTREDVAKAIRSVMVGEKGEKCRKKTMEMSEVIADKDCHEQYVDGFVKFLKSYSYQKA